MTTVSPGTLVREEAGSSLLFTLVVITIMGMLVGAVVALLGAQYRFLRRDAHRLQARYAAEAGVYVAMDSLQRNPFWRAVDAVVDLPEGQACRVSVEAFGGYLLIRSEARYRRSRGIVRAFVGEAPPASFHNAVVLWDEASSLHVAGGTRITGDVVVGKRGLKKSTFKRRRFTGRVDGSVYRVPGLKAPFFDTSFLQGAVEEAERYLDGAPTVASPAGASVPLAVRLPSENDVHRHAGSLRLTEADSLLLREPVTVVVQGTLRLDGPLRFQPGTMFIAGQTLHIGEGVTGREGLFFGRDGVETSGDVRLAGQLLSRASVRVARGALLDYPSVVYATGDAAETGGGIVLEGGATVDGTVVHPPLEVEPAVPRGRIVVEPAARLRGALFNAHETEFHGTLYGSLLTYQLYFYEAPTTYMNWLKDAVIDAPERPIAYLLPLRFTPSPRLAVLHWDARVDEPARPT